MTRFWLGLGALTFCAAPSFAADKHVELVGRPALEKQAVEKNADEAEAPGGTVKRVYKKLPDGDLSLEIDLPTGKGPFPVVVYIHGGGWKGAGEPKQFRAQSRRMTRHGVAGVRILYRGSGRGGFDETMQDVMDAIEYTRQHADEFKFDIKRLGLAGGSAGGHLSAIAAQRAPECVAYVGFNGLYDVVDPGEGKFGKGGSKVGQTVHFLGTITPERQIEVSGMRQIKTPPPDTLLLHGTKDTTIDPDQAVRFAEAIRLKGGRARVVLYEGEVHAFFNKTRYRETSAEMEEHFLRVFGIKAKGDKQ